MSTDARQPVRSGQRYQAANHRPWKRHAHGTEAEYFMRGILLWLVGIPIPIIILLYLFHVL